MWSISIVVMDVKKEVIFKELHTLDVCIVLLASENAMELCVTEAFINLNA